jgi:predicted DNA-binding transcriptional regulator AlpA
MTTFLTAAQLRARYGVSDMTLWRWLADEKLRFPRPTTIRKRRYWSVPDIEHWERSRAASAA